MHKVQGDAAAIVAATLTQAEVALRAAANGGADTKLQKLIARMNNPRLAVQATYEHYLAFVTTGVGTEAADAGES
ncbi:hypothetical protein [Sphingomonas dokdonensis]|uniref:Uncharacterized protein n=1 Tax=Sphingomonas dokdonensis TaxID=344880 RepID=A0A245ZDV9_9SPHN|nr:hypothetical protein [Sphingomonas dokdonensis]OWK27889.1 hypothetical protein SPDO_29720 [Sphingomonas dokdonensis]